MSERLFRWSERKKALIPSKTGGPARRPSSPAPGYSILMTSALRLPSSIALDGAARCRPRSTTRTPVGYISAGSEMRSSMIPVLDLVHSNQRCQFSVRLTAMISIATGQRRLWVSYPFGEGGTGALRRPEPDRCARFLPDQRWCEPASLPGGRSGRRGGAG